MEAGVMPVVSRKTGTEFPERVFVIEIGGRAALAFQAHNSREAVTLKKELWLQEELKTMQYRDAPLWDGVSALNIRAARAPEIEAYTRALRDRKIAPHADDDLFLATLTDD